MNELQLLIFTVISYSVGVGIGYFACLYRNQHVLIAGRAALAKVKK